MFVEPNHFLRKEYMLSSPRVLGPTGPKNDEYCMVWPAIGGRSGLIKALLEGDYILDGEMRLAVTS